MDAFSVFSTDDLCKHFRSSSGRLASMDVLVSHIEERIPGRAVILINCALFINWTSLIEEGSNLNSLLYFQGNPLCLEKLGFHMRCVHLNVNNVHYALAYSKDSGCLIYFIYMHRLDTFWVFKILKFHFLEGVKNANVVSFYGPSEGVIRFC